MKGRDLLTVLGDELTPSVIEDLQDARELSSEEGSSRVISSGFGPVSRTSPPPDEFSAMFVD